MRTTLTSAEAKPCIYQIPLPPRRGESTVFSEMVDALDREYGRSGMIGVIDGDAGLTSLSNADHVNERGYALRREGRPKTNTLAIDYFALRYIDQA